jgi:SAM-dependent methyltransferase
MPCELIGSGLPDVSRLAALPRRAWIELSDRFRVAGFDGAYMGGVWKSADRPYDAPLQRPVLLWEVRRSDRPAAFAYRIFIVRDPVREQEAVHLLDRSLMGELIDALLLTQPEPRTVVSVLDIRLFRGYWSVCDDLLLGGDAIFGAGIGTTAFCGIPTWRGRLARALNVGCGAGAVALWLSRYAERVVAADINPRALDFVRINAALNGNVETREGDLFEPVSGDRFDFIASQPPYVPAAANAPGATYLYAGPIGDELVTAIFAEIPKRLEPQGRAIVVFERSRRDGFPADCAGVVPGFGRDMRVLFLLGSYVDAGTYSIRHALPEARRGIEAFDLAVTRMREHLHNVRIDAVCPAVAVFEHAGHSAGWVETVQASTMLWDEVSTETVERLLRVHALLHEPASRSLPRASIRIPDGALVIRRRTAEAAGRTRLPRLPCRAPVPIGRVERSGMGADRSVGEGRTHRRDTGPDPRQSRSRRTA